MMPLSIGIHDVLADPKSRVYIASVDNVPVGYIVAVIAHRFLKTHTIHLGLTS